MQHTKIRKGNLKFYALTNMQTKKKKFKLENKKNLPPSPCLDQSYYSNKKKIKEGDREERGTSSPDSVWGAPKPYDLLKIGTHRASATLTLRQDLALLSRHRSSAQKLIKLLNKGFPSLILRKHIKNQSKES